MTPSLDEKLKNLSYQSITGNQIAFDFTDKEVEVIKQAFVEAGYKQVGVTGLLSEMSVEKHSYVGANGKPDVPLLSGQEFYDRFERELKQAIKESGISGTGAELLQSLTYAQIVNTAVKRAAGIAE